jgi:hypothetical protein
MAGDGIFMDVAIAPYLALQPNRTTSNDVTVGAGARNTAQLWSPTVLPLVSFFFWLRFIPNHTVGIFLCFPSVFRTHAAVYILCCIDLLWNPAKSRARKENERQERNNIPTPLQSNHGSIHSLQGIERGQGYPVHHYQRYKGK